MVVKITIWNEMTLRSEETIIDQKELVRAVCGHIDGGLPLEPIRGMDGWAELSKDFYRQFLRSQIGDVAKQDSLLYSSPLIFVKKLREGLLVLRLQVRAGEGHEWIFCRNNAETGTFFIVELPDNCAVDSRTGAVSYEVSRGRVAIFEEKHPSWPMMLVRPRFYRGLAILEYVLKSDSRNPLTTLLGHRFEETRFIAEGLKDLLEEALEEMRHMEAVENAVSNLG